jgi:hypothetical protein
MKATRLDAAGQLRSSSQRNVWTGTNDNGNPLAADCSDWTTTAASGHKGNWYALYEWSAAGTSSCSIPLPFYCVSKFVSLWRIVVCVE